jgi:hypothetical protein
MDLQGKLDSFVRVKAELLKRLQHVWSIDNTTPNRMVWRAIEAVAPWSS